MTELNPSDLDSLALKLDQLDLTDAEGAILDGILSRAADADDEVAGYIWQMPGSFSFKVEINGQFRPERLAESLGVQQIGSSGQDG